MRLNKQKPSVERSTTPSSASQYYTSNTDCSLFAPHQQNGGHFSTLKELRTLVLPRLQKDLKELNEYFTDPGTPLSYKNTSAAMVDNLKIAETEKALIRVINLRNMDGTASSIPTKEITDFCNHLNNINTASQRNAKLFNVRSKWMHHYQLLFALYSDLYPLVSTSSVFTKEREVKEEVNEDETTDKEMKPINITARLASYIHRLRCPVFVPLCYVARNEGHELNYVTANRTVHSNSNSTEKIDFQQHQQIISPFLWDNYLGFRVSLTSAYKISLRLQPKPLGGIFFRLRKVVAGEVFFGTHTHCYIANGIRNAKDIAILRKHLSVFKISDPPNYYRHGKCLANLWKWTEIVERVMPVRPLDKDMLDQVLGFIRLGVGKDGVGLRQDNAANSNNNGDSHIKLSEKTKKTGNISSHQREVKVGSMTYLFGTSGTQLSSAFRLQDTLLPLVIEHKSGVRVYPYTRDPMVLSFYLNTKTSAAILDLEKAHSFIVQRQKTAKLYSPLDGSTGGTSGAPASTDPDPVNTLDHVPPPVNFSDNIVLVKSEWESVSEREDESTSAIVTGDYFKFKTLEDALEGPEFRRIYVRDQSQYILDVDETPTLMGDLGVDSGGGALGEKDQVRYVMDLDKCRGILYDHGIELQELGDSYLWQNNRQLCSQKVILEDFRHSLKIGCHSGFQQVGSILYATTAVSVEHTNQILMFNRDAKSHRCYLDDKENTVHFAYLKWGSKSHRARMIEDLDLCISEKNALWPQKINSSTITYKKDAYLFFVDNAPQMYEKGFKRFTECHLYSLIAKYTFKYHIIIEMMTLIQEETLDLDHLEDLSHLESKIRLILHEKVTNQKQKGDGYINDSHHACFSNQNDKSSQRCKLLTENNTILEQYQRLRELDLQLKALLHHPKILLWVIRNGKFCSSDQLQIPASVISLKEKYEEEEQADYC